MAEREEQIAHSLRETHQGHADRKELFIDIHGVHVTHPFHEVETMAYSDYVPEGIAEAYNAGVELMNPATIPSHWIDYLKEVDVIHKQKATDFPIDLLHGVFFLLNDSLLARSLSMDPLPNLPEGGPDIRDIDQMRDLIDTILAHKGLRDELTTTLSVFIPDNSQEYLSRLEVHRLLQKLNITSGFLLNVGCGMGNTTTDLAEETSLHVIGVDRQYHPNWYDPHWNAQRDNLSFARADMQALPLGNETVDVVTMEFVVPYIKDDALAQSLVNIKDVLKNDKGLLFVGPQNGEDYSQWRVFQKEKVEGEDAYQLVEYTIKELMKKAQEKSDRQSD